MHRSRRPIQAARTRRSILTAARAAFAEQGYSGANLNAIVAHANHPDRIQHAMLVEAVLRYLAAGLD